MINSQYEKIKDMKFDIESMCFELDDSRKNLTSIYVDSSMVTPDKDR